MSSRGIQGLYVETHNWGATVSFWQELGYELTFETDHHSGQLVHPKGGPYLFVAEHPADHALAMSPIIEVDDADAFVPPPTGTATGPFTPTHWNTQELALNDPDGRTMSVQAPPAGTTGADWSGLGA
jgi:hypothetical protein